MLTTLLLLSLAAAAPPTAAEPPVVRTAPASQRDLIDRRSFEQGLRESSGGPVFAAIERHFPEDSVQLIDRLYTYYRGNRGNLTAVMQQALNEMDRYSRSKMHHVVNAPTANLVELNRRALAAMRVLRARNVPGCARMAMGAGPGSPREAVGMNFHEMNQLGVAMIEVAGIGSRSPEIPGRGQPNQDHIVAWALEMERLDPEGRLRALMMEDGRLEAATPAEQCDFGILVHQSVAAMEPEAAASVYSLLLVEAQRQRPQQQ